MNFDCTSGILLRPNCCATLLVWMWTRNENGGEEGLEEYYKLSTCRKTNEGIL